MFKRRAHIASPISVHLGIGQRCRTHRPDVESPAILPSTSTRNVPVGRWVKVKHSERTEPARLAYMLVLVSVAVPLM